MSPSLRSRGASPDCHLRQWLEMMRGGCQLAAPEPQDLGTCVETAIDKHEPIELEGQAACRILVAFIRDLCT